MTKFLAYYHLRPIHDIKDFIGISEDSSNSNIIATIGRNVVSITNIASQKEICSWTVLDKLSSKVVYDKASRSYVGVFGNSSIRCWNSETTDLNNVKKLKFKRKILDLIPNDTDSVLVLYSNGTCEPLPSAIENRKLCEETEGEFRENMEIFQSKLFNIPNSPYKLLTYFLKRDKKIELVTILLDKELSTVGEPVSYCLIRHDESLKLAGYTIVENQFSPCLLTIWSDKRIFILPLDKKSSPEDSPGSFVAMLNALNTTQPLSIIGLSKHCIVIYGANTSQEGGSLVLFNTQYNVVKAKQFFKIYFNFSKLWVINNYILLAMGQNLSVITFDVRQELLCDMVGSQFSNHNQPVAIDELIEELNEECYLEENIFYAENAKKPVRTTPSKIDDIKKCEEGEKADGKDVAFRPFQTFDEQYKSLCKQNIHVEMFSTKDTNDDIFSVNLMSNMNADRFTREEFEIFAKNLKKYGASEQEISEKLIILAIRANLIEDIAICLRTYTNIYERIIVSVLKFSLQGITLKNLPDITDNSKTNSENGFILKEYSCPNDDFPNVDISLGKPNIIAVSKPFDLLNVVLSCSFDVDLISKYIRSEIELEEALILMQHLYNLIKSKEICLEERADTSIEFDEDSKILQWFGIILNTHFQKLSLSRDIELIELLMKWNEIILKFRSEILELQNVASSLYNLVERKNRVQKSKYSKWYSVERIQFF
ncbi:uncharacterized protein LOC129606948 [Condylostylus longicornis]|uniref:uncharacterized protein LOC129606948 n=1 Tax=Condylostylus longicornis TaxID=2530218 RepID=UPI00244DFB0C|nr:uncharacterized protein LOC129606948 [Condylostylus longicornis]